MLDSNKIKGLMAEKGINQRNLAERTGYGLNHINEVLNNKVSPRLDLVNKICDVLEITDDSLKIKIFFN